MRRAQAFLQHLGTLPPTAKRVAVVSHGVLLDMLLRCLTLPPHFKTTHFGNAEVRQLHLSL